MRTSSTASFASTSSSTLNQSLNFILNPVELERFEHYRKMEGTLEKLSSSFLVGWQKRYFKLNCKKTFLLAYYKEDKKNEEPQGVLNLAKFKAITKDGDKK